MVDGPTDDQNPEDKQPENDPHSSDQDRAGLDFLVSVADTRIQLYFDQNWPTMLSELADAVAKKIDPEEIAARAEQIFEARWKLEAARRQAAAAGGDGGDNGSRPTASGADGGGGGDGDLGFLSNVPDGDAGDQAAPSMPISTDRKQAIAIAGLRILEDPMGTIERAAKVWFDIADRRRPKTPPRNDLDVIEDLARRRPWLIDTFASQDPMSAPEKLANAMFAGAKSGMSFAEAVAKYNIRATTSKPAPRFKPPKVEVDAAAPTPVPTVAPTPEPAPTPTSEPVAPMAQVRPARRRRRLQDAV